MLPSIMDRIGGIFITVIEMCIEKTCAFVPSLGVL